MQAVCIIECIHTLENTKHNVMLDRFSLLERKLTILLLRVASD